MALASELVSGLRFGFRVVCVCACVCKHAEDGNVDSSGTLVDFIPQSFHTVRNDVLLQTLTQRGRDDFVSH